MHALCPSHRQSRRQQTKYDCMSVTLTSDHSKIFFAAVTAAFAAPPPGRTATAAAAALRPLPPALRAAALPHAAAALPQPHSVTVVGDSSATRRHVSACGTPCAAAAALPLHSGCHSLPVPASLRGCAAALPPHCLRRVRTESALTPQCRRCRVTRVCRRAALPRVPAVPPHCGALES